MTGVEAYTYETLNLLGVGGSTDRGDTKAAVKCGAPYAGRDINMMQVGQLKGCIKRTRGKFAGTKPLEIPRDAGKCEERLRQEEQVARFMDALRAKVRRAITPR